MDTPDRYRSTDGTIVTREQIERDFKRTRIVAGQSTSGEDYNEALLAWVSTYDLLSAKQLSREGAPYRALFVCLGLTAVVSIFAGLSSGFLVFIIVFVLGFIGSLGVVFWVTLFTDTATTPVKKSAAPDFKPGSLR